MFYASGTAIRNRVLSTSGEGGLVPRFVLLQPSRDDRLCKTNQVLALRGWGPLFDCRTCVSTSVARCTGRQRVVKKLREKVS